jgi:hypothetical protein
MARLPGQPDFYTTWIEPESAANTANPPQYPYNHVTQTKGGHSFEMDDTPDRERIRLNHRSGTFIEMHPNGDEVHKIYGDGYEIILQDKNVKISGNCNVTIVGNCDMVVNGNYTQTINGDFEQHILGNYTQVVEKQAHYTSQGDTTIQCGGFLGGGLKIHTGDHVLIEGDLVTTGSHSATNIVAKQRVDALGGMSAGVQGFVTEFGGIAVGTGVAVPGSVNSIGPIDSATSVASPLATHGVAASIFGFDVVNNLLHNIHTHISPKGPTGPPLPPEASE